MEIIFSVLIATVVFAVILYIVLMQVRVKQVKQANTLLEEFKEENILAYTSAANFVGIESKGMGQVRGNGFLLLSSHFLLFERLAPKMRVNIVLRKIIRVDQVSSFLGKRNIKPVLRIFYTDEHGEQDKIGFFIKDPDKWQNLIRKANEQSRKFV
ncbi:MAG: hypothetical protein JEZ00_10740 [Anaerolineaceae bacterium]|nr:hypothetical protein [Anaerolineaceae bacterium]